MFKWAVAFLALALASVTFANMADARSYRVKNYNASYYVCCARTASGMTYGKKVSATNPHIIATLLYPLGTRLELVNIDRPDKKVCVVVEDKGPYVRGRKYDVTLAGMRELGFQGLGNLSAYRSDCYIPTQYLNPARVSLQYADLGR